MNNTNTQQQFLQHKQTESFGSNFQTLPMDKQMRFNNGIMTQANNNPNAAGNMLNEFRSGANTGGEGNTL